MHGHFTIEADRRLLLVRVTLAGFLDISDAERFPDEVQKAIGSLGCAPHQHLTLVDVSGFRLQSQAVMEVFMRQIADSRFASRKLAFVAGGSLARMQVRRLLGQREAAACFEDTAAALAWLFDKEECPAA